MLYDRYKQHIDLYVTDRNMDFSLGGRSVTGYVQRRSEMIPITRLL